MPRPGYRPNRLCRPLCQPRSSVRGSGFQTRENARYTNFGLRVWMRSLVWPLGVETQDCILISANLLRYFSSKLPRNRHPERSASQIYRVSQRLWRGVEGPRRGSSYPCCSELFNHRSPRTGSARSLNSGLIVRAEGYGFLAQVGRQEFHLRPGEQHLYRETIRRQSTICKIGIQCLY
jgi:hypothetical protein